VNLGGANALNLFAGTYVFDSLSAGNGLDLNLDLTSGAILLYVLGQVTFGETDMFLTGGGPNDVYLEAQGTFTNAFRATGGSTWYGTVFTPNGGIHFGGSGCCSSFTGHFWANGVADIEHGVTGTLPPPAIPEPTSALLLLTGLGALTARRIRR
jgi:hypothetical protein